MSCPLGYNVDELYSSVSSTMDTNIGSKPCRINCGSASNVSDRILLNSGDILFKDNSCGSPPFSTFEISNKDKCLHQTQLDTIHNNRINIPSSGNAVNGNAVNGNANGNAVNGSSNGNAVNGNAVNGNAANSNAANSNAAIQEDNNYKINTIPSNTSYPEISSNEEDVVNDSEMNINDYVTEGPGNNQIPLISNLNNNNLFIIGIIILIILILSS